MSVAEAITLMLAFGSFVLSLVNTFVTLVKAMQDNQQTNMSDEPRLDGILVRHFSFLIKWC